MKKYISWIFAAGLVAGLSACSDDFLDVTAPSQIPTDEYYTTKAHINELLVSAYTPLVWNDWSQGQYNPLNIMADVMADDIWVGGADAGDNENWHLMSNFSATPERVISGIWINAYNGVRRCNYVFEYMPKVTDIDDATKALWLTEARVLRSYYYSWVWKFWGDVPFYTENLTFPYKKSKSPADEVYAGIIEDLETAIAADVLPMKNTGELTGHVTKAMAYMLYAELVMYQNDDARKPTALRYMEEIISSGQYDLFPDYDALWDEENEWCQENIFSISYFHVNASRSWGNPYYAGGTVLPTLISPNGLTAGAECNGKYWGEGEGWGFAPVRQETYDAFEAGDTRRDGSINDFRGVDYNFRYQDTGLWLRKFGNRVGYNADQIADAVMNFGQDLPIYRYAETLLNAAELGSPNAQQYLDKVRSRAGLGSKPATLDNILNERRFEFVGEGKRYFDLVRTGRAASVLVPDDYGYRTKSWTESRKYLPIPISEINASDGALVQNPNY